MVMLNPEMLAKEKAELRGIVIRESQGGPSRPPPAMAAELALRASPGRQVGIDILLPAAIEIRTF